MTSISFDFTDHTILVTGSGQGIGFAIAQGFADAGANVCVVDRDPELAEAAAAEIGAQAIVADVSSTESVDAMVDEAIAAFGRIDAVVNNAGIARDAVLWKLSDEAWDSVLGVHLGGTFRVTRACVPHFRAQRRGRVINVTSYTGMHGNLGQANYAAAKAGIIGFTKTAAKELARFGVTVNAISPNAKTPMVAAVPAEQFRALEAMVPMGRFAEPTEMWPAVGYLASDEAAYVTGAVLAVDGGIAM